MSRQQRQQEREASAAARLARLVQAEVDEERRRVEVSFVAKKAASVAELSSAEAADADAAMARFEEDCRPVGSFLVAHSIAFRAKLVYTTVQMMRFVFPCKSSPNIKSVLEFDCLKVGRQGRPATP